MYAFIINTLTRYTINLDFYQINAVKIFTQVKIPYEK